VVSTKEQYEVFPYPERLPADEKTRLIGGSPSHPLEIDHYLFAGQRDWSRPLRALVAGGGTGDGLIQLAQVLHQAGRPYEITYLDLSEQARAIAEERAKIRGLANIRFLTGSLLESAEHGPFDYIDCCGVLHHLPDPVAGFAALRAALAPGGGMGFMVYAPYGRSGVYPLQEAFGSLFAHLKPKARLAAAKAVFAKLPEGHPFRRNPHLGDHRQSDAGFYDLLLHGQDVAMAVPQLLEVLAQSDWQLQSFSMPVLYDASPLADVPNSLSNEQRMAVAEKLNGTIKTHVGYLVPKGENRPLAKMGSGERVPHIRLPNRAALAQAIARGRHVPLSGMGVRREITLAKAAAPLIAAADGRRNLIEIAKIASVPRERLPGLWQPVEAALTGFGLLHYSNLLRAP